jgi:hypothetical protein
VCSANTHDSVAAAEADAHGLTATVSQAAVPATGFTETEQMGIAVWNTRGDQEKKTRRGDGLPWDAPGFDAP